MRWWRSSAKASTTRRSAARLFMSPATAKTHVSRAMIKLHARDRAQLVVIAYESGLVRPGWSWLGYARGGSRPAPRLRPDEAAQGDSSADSCRAGSRRIKGSVRSFSKESSCSTAITRRQQPLGRPRPLVAALPVAVVRVHRLRLRDVRSGSVARWHRGSYPGEPRLAERYAAGEIDETEYRKRLAVLAVQREERQR